VSGFRQSLIGNNEKAKTFVRNEISGSCNIRSFTVPRTKNMLSPLLNLKGDHFQFRFLICMFLFRRP
jgi:hypothetical protein